MWSISFTLLHLCRRMCLSDLCLRLSYASLHASPECPAEGLHGKKKPSLSSPAVNTYRTYLGVEPETVSLLSFSQISCSPEIRKLSVKHHLHLTAHISLLHICSLLFLFFVLFVFTFCFWHCSPGRTSSFAPLLQ